MQTAPKTDAYVNFLDDMSSASAFNFVQRIMEVLRGRRLSPDALVALCDSLEALPQVDLPAPTTARDRAIKHMLMMDKLREAALQARAKAYETWEQTSWAQAQTDNFMVVDGQTKEVDGKVIQDACAICAAPKTECVKPGEHFGQRGESPPDSKCDKCSRNFGNFYDAKHDLSLHVAKKHRPADQAV